MVYCVYCRKNIPDQMVGLINFALSNHRCPAMVFSHCPNCGIDIDDNIAFWGYKNKHELSDAQIKEILK
jgi:hypothetical protein